MINIQSIEKRNFRSDGLLEVHSIFNTIQGEGPFCGQQAVFVRLAGCNLQCPKCDTDYTQNRKSVPVNDVLLAIFAHNTPNKLVVITGGEPFRQDISMLVNALVKRGFNVQIETNGTLPIPANMNWVVTQNPHSVSGGCYIVCSPKSGKVHSSVSDSACAWKYVVSADAMDEDGLPTMALDHTATPRLARPPKDYTGPIYVQPCDDENAKANLQACVESVMNFGYTLQLQIHKLIGME